jgi:hypothetical protein
MEKQLKNLDDTYTWSLQTADALRAGDFSRIDMEELINQIDSIASGLRRELGSALLLLLEALLVGITGTRDKDKPAVMGILERGGDGKSRVRKTVVANTKKRALQQKPANMLKPESRFVLTL